MPATYEPIATSTPTSGYSVTFSSIPSTYTDLVLVISGPTSALSDFYIQPNSDGGSNYRYVYLSSSTVSIRAGGTDGTGTAGMLADNFGQPGPNARYLATMNFMNYINTTTFKSALSRSNNSEYGVDVIGSTWQSTSAITSLFVQNVSNSSTFSSGTTFTLYGIKAA